MKKPLLRGHVHQEAFFLAIGACAMLVARASNALSLLAGVIYSLCLIVLFGISAIYHRPNWSIRNRVILRRLDHSAIYFLIGGSFTPVCLLALPEAAGIQLLKIVYSIVILGVLKTIFWVNAPKIVSLILYSLMALLFLPYLKEFNESLGMVNMILIWSGCAIYFIGGVFYALKKPNFFPGIFGHHELFHVFTVIGALLHFLVMYKLIH